MTAKQIEAAAVKLPRKQRLRLAQKLLETIPLKPNEQDPDVLAAWVAEAERRIDDFDNGREIKIPAEEVFAEIRDSFRK
ncbi:MAG TPA: addiction module protein [Candidatus Binataceae bacterium]|nr:addiction module protein [Candidatus Binataceae bacterium]